MPTSARRPHHRAAGGVYTNSPGPGDPAPTAYHYSLFTILYFSLPHRLRRSPAQVAITDYSSLWLQTTHRGVCFTRRARQRGPVKFVRFFRFAPVPWAQNQVIMPYPAGSCTIPQAPLPEGGQKCDEGAFQGGVTIDQSLRLAFGEPPPVIDSLREAINTRREALGGVRSLRIHRRGGTREATTGSATEGDKWIIIRPRTGRCGHRPLRTYPTPSSCPSLPPVVAYATPSPPR